MHEKSDSKHWNCVFFWITMYMFVLNIEFELKASRNTVKELSNNSKKETCNILMKKKIHCKREMVYIFG